MTTIDLVVPCYNPDPEWQKLFLKTAKELNTHGEGISYTFILVDDGSNPEHVVDIESITSAEKITILRHSKNKGKGAALQTGIRTSKNPYLIYTDMDFPYTADSIQSMARRIVDGENDFLIGVREPGYFEVIPKRRRLISKILLWFNKTIVGLKVHDTQAGLKAMNTPTKELALTVNAQRFLL